MSLSCADETERAALREVLEDRFGVDAAVLADWRVLASGAVLWGVRESGRLDEVLAEFDLERTGLPLLRRVGPWWKPTSSCLRTFGEHLSRERLELTAEELDRLLAVGFLRGTRSGISEGYVALAGPDGVVGCGLYLDPRPEEDKPEGVLQSLLPKRRWSGLARQLREEL
jgi:hypothetical protein